MSAATATRQFVYVYPTFCVLSTSCPHQSPFGTIHTRLLPPPAMDNTPSFLLSPLNVLDEKGVLQNMSPGGERTDEHTNTHTCGNKCAIITTNTAHRQKGRYPRATRLLAGSGKILWCQSWSLASPINPRANFSGRLVQQVGRSGVRNPSSYNGLFSYFSFPWEWWRLRMMMMFFGDEVLQATGSWFYKSDWCSTLSKLQVASRSLEHVTSPHYTQ